MSDYSYDAIVRSVHDGDTITCDIDLGLDMWIHDFKIRLFGLNAPELNTPMGKIAQKYLAQQLPLGQKVLIVTQKDKTEKYGRYLATILKPGTPATKTAAAGPSVDVNALLIASGNAKPWDGQGVRPV